MSSYDNPRPTSQPIGSTDLVVAKDNLITLDRMVSGPSGTPVSNRKGEQLTPLVDIIDSANSKINEAIGASFGVFIGNYPQTYTNYNQYTVFNGQQYGIKTPSQGGPDLPYTPTETDPANDANLKIYGDASQSFVREAVTVGQEELIGGQIYPEIGNLENGMTVPSGTTHLRVGGQIYAMSSVASGLVADLTTTSATIGGVSVNFYRRIVEEYATLDDAVSSLNLYAGMSVLVKERTAGNGGGATWDVVHSSSVTANTFSVVECTGIPDLSLSIRADRTVTATALGAKGDGVNDDADAIQHGIDAFGSLYLPRTAGFYKTTKPIYLNASNQIICDVYARAEIKKTTNTIGVGSNLSGSVTDTYDKDAVIIIKHADNAYATYVNMKNVLISCGANNEYAIYAPRVFVSAFDNVHLNIENGKYGYVTHDTFMTRFTDVQVSAKNNNIIGSIGMWFDDQGDGGSGTSCLFDRCWIRDGVETAWKARGLVYSTWNACGTDKWVKHALDVDLCDITLNGFGFENRQAPGSSPFKIRYSRVNLNNAVGFSVNIANGSYLVDSQGGVTNINGLRHTTTAAGAGLGRAYRVADNAHLRVSQQAISANLGDTTPEIDATSRFTNVDTNTTQGVDGYSVINGKFSVKSTSGGDLGYLRSLFDTSTALQSVGAVYLGANNSLTLYHIQTVFRPYTSDNSMDLGSADHRFKNIYAGTGTINTSDGREKTKPTSIPVEVLEAWGSVPVVRWKFLDAIEEKGEDNARWHVGRIAQDVERSFAERGLNAFEWGVLCYDHWPEQIIEQPGSLVKKIPAGSRYGIRESEAANLEAAYIRHKLNL